MRLDKYTKEEVIRLSGGKIITRRNNNNLIAFINESKKEGNNKKLYFGKISNNLAIRIEKDIGINIQNYNLSLKSDSIRHILKKHSSERELLRGQVIITEKDFKLIPKIVTNYDKVSKSGLTKQGKQVITFEKEIKDKYYLINNISSKKHTLEVHTMYKHKKRTLLLRLMKNP